MNTKIEIQVPDVVIVLVTALRALGARALIVGGSVVDSLLGREPKDWDIEVYGASMSKLVEFFEASDYTVKTVGAEFGILKLVVDDVEIDVSVPRLENRVGVNHTDFEVEFDPNMSVKEAARRRDLTINALAYDPLTETLIDEWGGLSDLHYRTLRATDPEKFVEDPLRVLRIAQFLARGKGTHVDVETLELCTSIVDEFKNTSPERVFEEFNKLLLKGDKPSAGLFFLRNCRWIQHFPELDELGGCPQHPEWHPEGDAWSHTMLVVDNAAKIRDCVPEEHRLAFMYAAMLHDVGKPATTDPVELTSRGHDKAGVEPTKSFLKRILGGGHKKLATAIVELVEEHMQPFYLVTGNAKPGAWRRLHGKVGHAGLDTLGWLVLCDKAASHPEVLGDPSDRSLMCWHWHEEIGDGPIAPIVQGRDLIAAGLTPGPEFGPRLKAAFDAQVEDDSLTREQLLELALA